MHPHIEWHDIALRLLWTLIGGALIGINREEHSRAAGLRTTMLVCLAASLSMIQVNLLLPMSGKSSDSFVVLDLMRLPLGILSGMGFIGAGAILRRDNLVLGLTTAATLWFVTVMGLCFGGGQIKLGILALVLGFIILTGLKSAEKLWKQDRFATLNIVAGVHAPAENEMEQAFNLAGYRIKFISVVYDQGAKLRECTCEVRWRGKADETRLPDFVKQFAARFALSKLDWRNVTAH
jgi:putative Mg2+ transporter-C (MgtC) family protein